MAWRGRALCGILVLVCAVHCATGLAASGRLQSPLNAWLPPSPPDWPAFGEIWDSVGAAEPDAMNSDEAWKLVWLRGEALERAALLDEDLRRWLEANPAGRAALRLRIAWEGRAKSTQESGSLLALANEAARQGFHFEAGLAQMLLGDRHSNENACESAFDAYAAAADHFRREGIVDWEWHALDRIVALLLELDLGEDAQFWLGLQEQRAGVLGKDDFHAMQAFRRGNVLLWQGDAGSARVAADRGLALIAGRPGHRAHNALTGLRGWSFILTDEPHRAVAQLDAALWTARHNNREGCFPHVLLACAQARVALGDFSGARNCGAQATQLLAQDGYRNSSSDVRLWMGEAAVYARHYDFAREELEAAIAGLRSAPGGLFSYRVHKALSTALAHGGSFEQAWRHDEKMRLADEALTQQRRELRARTGRAVGRAGHEVGLVEGRAIAENALSQQRRRNRFLAAMAFMLAALLIILIHNRYREQLANNRLLRATIDKTLEAEKREIEANRMKTEFLASITHEIRTPLSGVIGMASLLEETQLTEEQEEPVGTIQTCAQSLLAMVNGILDLAQLEAGKLSLESGAFDPTALIAQSCERYRLQAQSKNLALSWQIQALPELVEGDAKRFRSVVCELIENAVKFTNEGSVHVTASAEPAGADAVCLTVTVKDTGVGLDPARGNRLFEAFCQADESNTRRFAGTGVGLALSRRLALLMGGGVSVESRAGEGSTFVFTSRLVRLAMEVAGSPDVFSARARRLRVLIYDPDFHALRGIATKLREAGASVDRVYTLHVLRRRLSGDPPPLAFILLGAESEEPLRLVHEIKETGLHSTHFVGVCAAGVFLPETRVREMGIDDFVLLSGLELSLPRILLKAAPVPV